MTDERKADLFANMLEGMERNGRETCYIVQDLSWAGATDEEIRELGYGWYLDELEDEDSEMWG